MGKLITAKTLSEERNIPLTTVWRLAREKRIAGVVRFGRKLMFDVDKVNKWIDEGGSALEGGWKHELDERAA